MKKVAVIVETREHKALPFVLENFSNNLPDEWKFQIFCGNQNEKYINKIQKPDRDFIIKKLDVDYLEHDDYVSLLTNEQFWLDCEGDIILTFQTDSMLCSNSKYTISDFENFDFIGGYWGNVLNPLDSKYNRVMNGGLSIRNKQFMLDIIRNELESYLNDGGNPCEDYFVSACLKNKPTFREVLTFCIDNGYMYPLNDEAPFGLHNPWGNNPQKGQGKYYEDIKKVCPEIVKLEELNGL